MVELEEENPKMCAKHEMADSTCVIQNEALEPTTNFIG